jgi:hypothetical protein
MLTCGIVLWNSWIKIGVKGAMESGVRTEMKTNIAWLMITMVFHVGFQFCPLCLEELGYRGRGDVQEGHQDHCLVPGQERVCLRCLNARKSLRQSRGGLLFLE